MPVLNRIAEFTADMTAWRRDFHAHPELGLEERRTAAIVAEKLRDWGVDEVHTGIARTGVVGVIRAGSSGHAIGLRADMDALPMDEESGVPYASTTPGVMHACGHDGHTAMLLGAARYLAETRRFDGTVYLIFQPSEERDGGGRMMVEEGLFERFPMDRVFGLHNMPQMPAGTFGWRDGAITAAVADLSVTVTGKGAHGAYPHQGVDPVVVASTIVVALQTVIARALDPVDLGVITIGAINGGRTTNVIPEAVRMLGTARWFSPAVGDLLEERFTTLCRGIAASFGAGAEPVFARAYPAMYNEPEATAMTVRAAQAVVGESRVTFMDRPGMGAEDFAFMARAKQASYILLGAGAGPDPAMCHHPRYDFNDAVLADGASFWAVLAEQLLPRA